MADGDNPIAPEARRGVKVREWTESERERVLHDLLPSFLNGKLRHGALQEVATAYNVSVSTVSRLWNVALENKNNPEVNFFCVTSKKNKRGRRPKYNREELKNQLRQVPFRLRRTIRSTARQVEISKTTLHKMLVEGTLRRHNSKMKPLLTATNKDMRLQFCSRHINLESGMFDEMMNVVHVDEKWFHLDRDKRAVYLTEDEDEPVRSTRHKSHITKVMFLAAVARPRWDASKNEYFNGKIGIFGFVEEKTAQRSSRNRPRGHVELKAMSSVRKDDYKRMIVDKVIPALKEKWPAAWRNHPILIQQDNASPHGIGPDEGFTAAAQSDGFDIRMVRQPPNSPDLNVLDLGFFASIQSLQMDMVAATVEELTGNVDEAFRMYDWKRLNNVFLTLQGCMEEIIAVDGGNEYKIPHMSKAKLEKEGRLPVSIKARGDIVQKLTMRNGERNGDNGVQDNNAMARVEMIEGLGAVVDM